MDSAAHEGGNGSGGGGPAPFLLKTYEMVEDASTDDIVSWSSSNASFVVWKPPDFSARLLPTYFKHNNFSSFIRQLNTYGFRKIDPERWEFANDEFIKGQKHLLKNIHRRKPIHSHSHPPGGGLADAERAALEEEIERLNREKTDLEANLWRFRQQLSGTENQMENLELRLADMEQRQLKIVAFMQRAMHRPQLMENLLRMAGASPADLSVIHKKRRLPADVNYIQEASANRPEADPRTYDKPHTGYALDKDFCRKLRLELSSAIPDDDLVTTGTQVNDFDHKLAGAPVCAADEGLSVRGSNEGGGLFSSHLSLTLSWTALHNESETSDLEDQGEANAVDHRTRATSRDNDLSISVRTSQSTAADDPDLNALPPQEVVPINDDAQGENDMFWQQFLTERPGS